MEDVATAEIARSQVWQWLHNQARLSDGRPVTSELVGQVCVEEAAAARDLPGVDQALIAEAQQLFEQLVFSGDFVEFLTLPGYDLLVGRESVTDAAVVSLPNA
jgi:malate synthase